MSYILTEMQKKEIAKNFRAQTGYSLRDCVITLEEVNFDINKARDILSKKYASKYSTLKEGDAIENSEDL